MGGCVRAALTLAAGFVAAAVAGPAEASERKLGVDPRQSGLDAAFVPDAPRSDLDRFRAHLGVDLATWLRQTPWPRSGTGQPAPRDDGALLGYRRVALGFGLGRGFADMVVAGIRFEYEATRGVQRAPARPGASARTLGFSAMPYLEVMMVRKARVRPYFMVRAGMGGLVLATDGRLPLASAASETVSLLYPVFGAGVGAHTFVTPQVSLDGSVTVDHRWEYARNGGALPDPAAVAAGRESIAATGRHNAFGRRISTSLVFSVSRWF